MFKRPIWWSRRSFVWHGVEIVGAGVDFATTLAAAKRGDEHAFIALFRPLQPRLLWYFRTLGPQHAEDLAAETWLKVAHALPHFEGDEDGFRAWVFAIARTRRADRLRADGKQPEFVTLASVAEAEMPVEPSAEDVVHERDATERALRLIAGLSPDEAEVITLRLVAGLDVGRTAAIVGKRPGTVRVLAHRGLRKLGQAIGPAEPAHAGGGRIGDGR